MQHRSVGCVLFTLAVAMAAAPAGGDARVIRMAPDAVPPRLIVQKGTVIEFGGKLPEDAMPVGFSVLSGAKVRATGQFQKQWVLRWDSAVETSPTCSLTLLRIEPNGQQVRLARSIISIVDKPPFRLDSPAPNQKIDGKIVVKVAAAGSMQMSSGVMLVDGKPMGATLDAKGEGQLDLAGLKPGVRQISVRVRVEGAGECETDPVPVVLSAKVTLSRGETGPIDLRNSEQNLVLKVAVAQDVRAKSCELFLDGASLTKKDAPDLSTFTLARNTLATGDHTLHVEVETDDGTHYASEPLRVQVVGDALAEFNTFRSAVQKLLADGQAAIVECDTRSRLGYGEKVIAFGNLRSADLAVSQAFGKLTVPPSMSAADRQDLTVAVQDYSIAFGYHADAARHRLQALEAESDSQDRAALALKHRNDAVAMENKFDLMISTANERMDRVTQRVTSGLARPDEAAAYAGIDLTYPISGDPLQDFASWGARLEQVLAEGKNVIAAYERSGDFLSGPANLALRKQIATDVWISENVEKLLPPQSVSPNIRQELRVALQDVALGCKYRSRAARAELASIESRARTEDRSRARNLHLLRSVETMYRKADLTLATANERIRRVEQRLTGQ